MTFVGDMCDILSNYSEQWSSVHEDIASLLSHTDDRTWQTTDRYSWIQNIYSMVQWNLY